ncbi:amidohydrolase family protein [Pseudohalioglobus sediminis]|uniref:Amidohydrolase family protein n=1 Tax=Pseudohalioglobus sediminis TaxID=2606449 RepID=A0A5B0X3L2_9GAMM|nr:amidohydrolase family protein [Pseudohalioglobus sediminis]KAA1193950.1 amidohydrolase family protein [Pseudohalioglobus sediminis]
MKNAGTAFVRSALFALLLISGNPAFASQGSTDKAEAAGLPADTEFDIVILGGRVMDPESGLDAPRNVGIKSGKVAIITEEAISGGETIDATDHVVSPGFIDLHAHAANIPFGQKLHLRDGVTTPLELEIGAYPVDAYYSRLEGKSQINYGATVGPGGIREKVVHPAYNSTSGSLVTDLFDTHEDAFATLDVATFLPSPEQISQINDMVEEGIKRGALGIGVPVGYMTTGTTSTETAAWQRLAGKYGLATFVHGRFSSQKPPTPGILGFQEMIAPAGIYGGGIYIHHLHQQALDQTPEALKMIDDARAAGSKIVAEIYPYYQGATIVSADYLVPENYGPNMGRSYEDIIEVATMKPLTKERYDELVKTAPATSVIFGGISEEGLMSALADPHTIIGSDGMPLTISATGEMAVDWDTPYDAVQGHPRGAGSHAKVLRLVRERNLMPLMLAISKMSYMPAKFLEENGVKAMASKGRMQVGADADIAIFHPETVTDNATMKQAGLPSSGIPYVIVNGTVVVRDSKVLKGVYPGKPIRNPILN